MQKGCVVWVYRQMMTFKGSGEGSLTISKAKLLVPQEGSGDPAGHSFLSVNCLIRLLSNTD